MNLFFYMHMNDQYRTIQKPAAGIYKEKGSRFMAFAYPVSTEDEVKTILSDLRKEYHDARHVCYAYQLRADAGIFRSNDDGEPSGTAGKPILNQIQAHSLTYTLVAVVRYFGGTLLGTSGLLNAYRSAASDALANASVVVRTVDNHYRLEFPYESMNEVMKIIKDHSLSQSGQVFDIISKVDIAVRQSRAAEIVGKLGTIAHLKIELLNAFD